MFLIFDTETTGFPKDWNAPITDLDNWPRVVQLAWQIHDEEGALVEVQDHIIYPDGFDIPFNSTKIHGISTERARNEGKPLEEVLAMFEASMDKCEYLIGHNVNFDLNVTGCEYYRVKGENPLDQKTPVDSCTETTAELCKLPGGRAVDTSCQNSRSSISTCLMKVSQRRTMQLLMLKLRLAYS